MIFGFFIFLIYFLFGLLKENNYFLRFKRKNIYLLFLIPIVLAPFYLYIIGYYQIPKLGYFEHQKKDFEKLLIFRIDNATRSSVANKDSGASYPSWTVPTNIKEAIYLTPIRMIYFLYSPFPWDIKRLMHLIGFIDAFFYAYLSFCILRNRENIYKNSQTRLLFILLIIYILIFSFGVGNFGTGIRHRLKFIGIFIVIAAPKILRIKLPKI
jgi:hypothetical protein